MRIGICAAAIVAASTTALGQLRIVSMNASNSSAATANPRAAMSAILSSIGDAVSDDPTLPGNTGIAKPIDILCLQEANSYQTTGVGYANLLMQLYPGSEYRAVELNGATTGSGTQVLIYRDSVSFVGADTIGVSSTSGQPRQTLRYDFQIESTPFSLYNAHFKAGTTSTDEARRFVEAEAIMSDMASRPRSIVLGDFNVTSSNDDSYQRLMTGPNRLHDPINAPGNWRDDEQFKSIHTQSPFDSSLGTGFPGTAGGMDDRFDQQLVTAQLNDGEGFAYIPNSYHAFGNNGSHAMNQPINSGSNPAAPLNLLAGNLDHLPVVADFQVPASLATGNIQPSLALTGPEPVLMYGHVQNAANATFGNGADELDYTLTVTGAASVTINDTVNGIGTFNTHVIPIDVSTAGLKTGTYNVTATSEETVNPTYTNSYQVRVLGHADPSFSPTAAVNAATLSFGIWPSTGSPDPIEPEIRIYNRAGAGSSDLFRDAILGLNNIGPFRILETDFDPSPGGSGRIIGVFEPQEALPGPYTRTVTIVYGDIHAVNRQTYLRTVTFTGFIGYPGDANLDLVCNISDFAILAANFNQTDVEWEQGDFNKDTVTNIADFALMAANFNTTAPTARSIPEPGMAGIGLILAVTWARRSRKSIT